MGNGDLFEIKALKSEILRRYATAVDILNQKSDGINESELEELRSMLTGERLQKELADESDDIKKFFGYFQSTGEIELADKPQETEKTKKSNKKEKKSKTEDKQETKTESSKISDERKKYEKELAATVKELAAKGKTKEQILNDLRRMYAAHVTVADVNSGDYNHDELGELKKDGTEYVVKERYAEIVSDVDKLMQIVEEALADETKSPKEEVDNAFENSTRKFRNNVTQAAITATERSKAEEYMMDRILTYNGKEISMIGYYETLRAESALNGVPKYKECVDKVGQALVEAGKDKEPSAQLALVLVEEQAKKDATERARADMNADKTDTKARHIKKYQQSLSDDPYYNEALKTLKPDRQNKAARNGFNNNLPDIKDMTYDEASTELSRYVLGVRTRNGEKTLEKLGDGFVSVEGETKQDNRYDFTELALKILSRVGLDYTLSRNDGDLNMAEIKNVKEVLWDMTGNEYTDNEVKRICGLCAVVVEGRDRSIGAILTSMGFGFVPTAIAAATTIPSFLNEISNLNLGIQLIGGKSISGLTDKEIAKEIEEKIAGEVVAKFRNEGEDAAKAYVQEYVKTHYGDEIPVEQILIQHNYINEADTLIQDLIEIGALNMIIPALLTAAFGADKQENSCVSVSDYAITEQKYTDPERFKAYIERRFGHNEVKAFAMQKLVELCVTFAESGETDHSWHEIYNDIVREMAGYGSKLNWKECLNFDGLQPNFDKYKRKEVCEGDDCMGKKTTTPDFKYEPRQEKYTGMTDAVKGYECLSKYDKYIKDSKGRSISLNRRMVKVIQAMPVQHLTSYDEVKAFYDVTKIAAFAEEAIKHGYDSANAKYPELKVNKEEYNAILNSNVGPKDGKLYVPDLYDPSNEVVDKDGTVLDDGVCNWVKPNHTPELQGGKGTGADIARKAAQKDGTEAYFRSCDGGENWERCTKEEYDLLPKKI